MEDEEVDSLLGVEEETHLEDVAIVMQTNVEEDITRITLIIIQLIKDKTCHTFNVNIVRGMVTTLLNVERKNMVKENKIKITKKILQNIMCLCMHKDC